MKTKTLLYYIYAILLLISFQLSYIIIARADDPNLTIDSPKQITDCVKLKNINDIKVIIKKIRSIATHPDSIYLRLHNKEREMIKKKLIEQPSLEIYLK